MTEVAEHPHEAASDEAALSPTEDLIMEVLACRHRLGETIWTFEHRHRRAINSLAEKGLVSAIHGTVSRSVRASLTALGRERYVKSDYIPPILRTDCPEWYGGDKTSGFHVDCSRTRGHKGRHWANHLPGVTWTTEEGRESRESRESLINNLTGRIGVS